MILICSFIIIIIQCVSHVILNRLIQSSPLNDERACNQSSKMVM